ncbi:hypothetical protein EYF80_003487 [Liparis tanakae]|uniref:Uncharacterized protein n=1 Tax=Liparis tanakae TaxID=230148 RepID=A0A4Z2J7K7_9TELE|nr:hypothetical protein EYF80_003487 [Liparis tanakae]
MEVSRGRKPKAEGHGGRGLAGATERGPATPPPLEAALFVSAPEADPPAVPAARWRRLAVIVAVFVAEAHLEEKLNWCEAIDQVVKRVLIRQSCKRLQREKEQAMAWISSGALDSEYSTNTNNSFRRGLQIQIGAIVGELQRTVIKLRRKNNTIV